MQIRRISSKDYTDYYEIRIQALSGSPEAFGMSAEEAPIVEPQNFQDKIQESNGAIFISYDGEPCGMVGVQKEKGIKRKHIAQIWGMYVAPNKRGRNVASLLLENVIQFAKSAKIEKLYLNVNTDNTVACGLYKKFGFKHYGTEKKALKISERYYDEYLFEMFL